MCALARAAFKACMFVPVGYDAGYDLRGMTGAEAAVGLTLSRKFAAGLFFLSARSPVYCAFASVDVFPR